MAAYTELEWNFKLQAPATAGDVYEIRVYAGSTPLDTYAVTPQLTAAAVGGVNYDETDLPITVAATVTATDQADWEEPALAVPVTATVTTVDQVDWKELLRSVDITADVTLPTAQADFKELARAVDVTADVTATDQVDFKDLALAVDAVATVTVPTDQADFKEPALSVTAVATVTVDDDYTAGVNPKVETLVDDFASTVDKTTKWPDSSAAVVWDAGRAKIPCLLTYTSLQTGMVTGQAYDLIGSSIHAKVTLPSNDYYVLFNVSSQSPDFDANYLSFDIISGYIDCLAYTDHELAGASGGASYNATNHAWLRFREATGTVYYDTSPDGVTWANLGTVPTPTWADAVSVSFSAADYMLGVEADVFIDNVNVPGVLVFNETSRPINVVADATVPTQQADFKEAVPPLATSVVVGFTAPTQSFTHLGNFSEPNRLVEIAAVVTATEQVDYKSNTDLAVPVVATVTAPTDSRKVRELDRPVPLTASVTETNQADFKTSPALDIPVTADFTAPTQTFTHLGNFNETGRPIPVVATVTELHQVDYKSNVDLSVPVTATVTATDKRKNFEPALTAPVVADTTATTQVDFKTFPTLSVPINTTIECTDNQQSPGHFEDTGLPVDIAASVALPTNQADHKDLARTVPVVATVTLTATHKRFEPDRSITVTATAISVVNLLKLRELGSSIPVISAVVVTHQADFKTFPALSVPIVSEVTCLDTVHRLVEARTVNAVASIAVTDQADFKDLVLSAPVAVAVSVGALLRLHEIFSADILATITRTDKMGSTLITVLNDADALYLGDEVVDRVYCGAVQVWP